MSRIQSSLSVPWVMSQEWDDVLFMSWPISPACLEGVVPSDIEVDLRDGQAWLSLLPLHMVKVHVRDLPPIPGLRTFPEINLRTYVKVNDEPGVFFISIDASNWIADWVAEHVFDMPFHRADMSFEKSGNSIDYTSSRADDPSVRFEAHYEPQGPLSEAKPGSLEQFLIERYHLFVNNSSGVLHRGDIRHDPWQVQSVRAEIKANSIPAAAGFDVKDSDAHFSYSPGTTSRLWPLVRVNS